MDIFLVMLEKHFVFLECNLFIAMSRTTLLHSVQIVVNIAMGCQLGV